MAYLEVFPLGARIAATPGGNGSTSAGTNRSLYDSVTGTPVFGAHPDGLAQHSGYHNNALTTSAAITIGSAPTKIGFSFRWWLVTNAATAAFQLVSALTAGATRHHIRQTNAAGTALQAVAAGGTSPSGPANPVAGVPYWIDVLIDVSGTTHTVDWRINGQKQTQATVALAASTISSVAVGNFNASGTGDSWVSDIVVYDAADYPIKPGYVFDLLPNASGTHNTGGAGNFTDDAAAQVNNGETTSWVKLDDWPPNITDYVDQAVLDATRTEYLEYVFQDIPAVGSFSDPKIIKLCGASFPVGSALANEAALRIYDADAGVASAEAVWDNSLTSNTLEYHCHTYKVRPGGGAWDRQALSRLRARVGFSNDVSPATAWSALLMQAFVQEMDDAPVRPWLGPLGLPAIGASLAIMQQQASQTTPTAGDWSPPTSPISTQLVVDYAQPMLMLGGPPVPGMPGQMIFETLDLGQDAVVGVPVAFAVPVAAATADGLIAVLQDTRTPAAAAAVAAGLLPSLLETFKPAEGDATAAGNVPALLATYLPAQGAAVAAGNTPTILDTRTPSEGDVTAAGLVPAMLITFGAPVAGAVAASPAPFMEIQADPAQQPLTFMGGLTRIGVSGPLLQQSTSPVGDVAAVGPVLFAVPVASATGAGPVPVMLDTHGPDVAAATAAGVTPFVLATFTPAEGDVAVASSTNGLANTFEGGTNGVAISTANSGGLSGDAFGNVNGTVTYSSVAARGGLSSTMLEPNGGTATAFVAYTGLGSLTTQTWGRAYFRMDTVPTQTMRILSLQTFAGTVCAGLTVTTAGLLRAQNATPTAIGVASTAIPLNQWFRVEYRLIPGTSTGEIEFRAWFNAESSGTPDWVSNNVGQALGANLSQLRLGITTGPTAVTADWNLWVDEVNGLATTWPGPASALPPVMQMTYAAPVASAVSAGLVPLMEFTSDPAVQPLVMLGGLPRIGISGPLLQQSQLPVGDVAGVNPVLFAVPVASAVGAGAVPVLLDTRQPSEGDTTAVGQVPALLGTWQPSVAAATADGNTPALLDTRAPAVAAATAAGNTPVLLITFLPGVAGAVAAAAVPLMEITSDPAMQPPLVFLGGLPRIGISGPLLQQSTLPVGDVAGVNPVLFAVPVAAATSVGLNPVLMATFAPAAAGATAVGNVPAWPWAAPVGSATASSPAPVWLDTHLPGVASATGAGQLPVLQVTYSIVVASGTAASAVPAWPWSAPVASATATSPTPALLITFTPAEGDATAAAPVAVMAFALAVTQDPFQLPFWGPLRTIPGSMTILKEQEPGMAAASLLLAVPVASASSAGLVPTLLETYAIGVASATAAGLTPAMLATVLPLVAAATAAGQAPIVQATYIAGVASATAAGLTPVQAATYGITVASAAAAGLAPVGVGTIKPGAASATAAANTPVYSAAYLPATSVVSAAAPVVTLRVVFTPAVGVVTAIAPVPVYDSGTSGGVHFIYAAEARTTMQSIAAVTLTGMAGATTRTAAPAGTGQGQAGRTGSTGNLDP